MDESLFKELVEKWVTTVNATLEDKSEDQDYLFRTLLRPQLSLDHKFSAISGTNTRVTADIVAMDSDLPLKSRGSLESYSGRIPKIGIQKYLKESDLSEIDILIGKRVPEVDLVRRIFDDYSACVTGSREKIELLTHQMLSNGIIEVPDENNTGTSIRVDFGVPDANRSGVPVLWSDPTADIAADLEAVYTKAVDNGDAISLIRMNRKTFNLVKKNDSVIALYKGANNFASDSSVSLNQEKVQELFMSEFNWDLQIIDRAFQVEKNGAVTSIRGWVDGAVSFWTTEGQVGTLTYADLAEKSRPVKTKTYSSPEPWLLAAKWSEGNPLREFTEASGIVIPVLNNVDHVYFLDTATVEV